MSGQTISLRAPTTEDGADVWRVASSCGLDPNSPYLYLLWCRDFADTSVIAAVDGATVGFVTGYRRPDEPATLFVWQVAVSDAWRRRGLAMAMLVHLCDLLAPGLGFVEASVTPSNEASASLFRSLATSSGVELASWELFGGLVFPPESPHDAELLFTARTTSMISNRAWVPLGAQRPVWTAIRTSVAAVRALIVNRPRLGGQSIRA